MTSKDTCTEICGDGKRFNSLTTYCDDGNVSSGDGCDSSWSIESGWVWSGGKSNTKDTWTEIWGDGKKFNSDSSYCDDENTSNNDGWSSTCSVEIGWTWSGGNSSAKDTWSEIWGDGKRFNSISTYCDDGNTTNNDGCDSSCLIESGWTWSGGHSSTNDIWTEIWGDGKRFNSKSSYWDDGNTNNGDGCNSSWQVEIGWSWASGSTTSQDSWSEVCGDGKVINVVNSEWDDGNLISGDGWNSSWITEAGYYCVVNQNLLSVWQLIWGNSITEPQYQEEWDDGNYSSGDGWSSSWAIEPLYKWSNNLSGFSTCSYTWGNGVTESQYKEIWDDGNITPGDGWSSTCTIESKYYWNILSNQHDISYWQLYWGNGKIDPGETCDDRNYSNGDGWNSDYKIEYGFNCINFLSKPSYWSPLWGNGVRDNSPVAEECDDGNNIDLDGWSGKWTVEKNYEWASSTSGPDVCKTIYSAPVIKSNTFDQTLLKIVIEFDKVMKKQNITLFDMELDVFGPNSPYSVSWSAEFDKNLLKISFTSSPVLLGGIGEKVQLQLINVLAFKSEYDISMEAPKLFEYTVYALSSYSSVQSGGSGASYTFIFVMLISLGVSLFTGGSVELMWSLANSLQIIFFFGYLNLYYTPELLTVFSYMKFSNFDNPIFEYIRSKTFMLFSVLKVPILSTNQVFGLSSVSIIINFIDKIIAISLLISLVLLLALLSYWLKDKNGKIAKFIKNKEIELRYEGLTRFFAEIVLGLSFLIFINMVYGNTSDLFGIASYVLSSLFLVSAFYMIMYWFLYPNIHYESILEFPDKHERHWLLFLEFNTDKLKNLHFYAYFLIHRVTFGFVVAWLSDFPLHQWVLTLILNLLMLIYTFKAYKSWLSNFLHGFNWFMLLALNLMLPMFLNSEDAEKLKIAGYVSISKISRSYYQLD